MPRFDRVYSLIVGQPGQTVGTAKFAATRAKAEANLAESRQPGLSPERMRQLTAENEALAKSLQEQAAGKSPGQGVEITDLRITFEVSKDDTKNPNKSKIEVWNAAPPTRALMERPDTRCVLRAGYVEEDGPLELFQGDVTFAWTRYDEADVVTTLELGDGAKATRNSVVSLGYGAGAATRRVLNDIAARMGLTLSMPDDAPVRAWQHGVSFHGSARAALDRVTRAAGLSWSIQGGVLQVIATNGTTNRSVVDLAADSGLLSNPERQRKGNAEAIPVVNAQTRRPARAASATQAWDGWRVKSLLLPFIVPGDRVKLSSRSVEGVFRVRDLKHHGDSHDGDWITELRLVDAAGAAPAASSRATRRAATPSLPVPPTPAPPPAQS